MEIGREVRRLREAKAWSQTKLAADAGMGVSGISQIETGARNPSVATLQRIAEALGVGVGDLFGRDAQPSLAEGEMEAAMREAEDSMLLLRSYFEDPPDEETADEAINLYYDSVPRVMEILAGMERDEMARYVGGAAGIMRENVEIARRVGEWNREQYGHLHEETA